MDSAHTLHDLDSPRTVASNQTLYTIDGVIVTPDKALDLPESYMRNITLSINNGEFKGFVRLDGRFTISGVSNGTHILEVHHPDIYFQAVKVEITGVGKFRARQVNYVQPSLINQVPYPLRLQPLVRRKYFRIREQWRVIDVLLNPLVLAMVLPMVFMWIILWMFSDPEAKKELDSLQFPKIKDMPDFSDMLSSYLSGKPVAAEPKPKEIAGRPRKN